MHNLQKLTLAYMSDNQCENSSLPDSQWDKQRQRKPCGGWECWSRYEILWLPYSNHFCAKKSYKTLLKVECSHRMQFYLLSEVETPCVRNNNTYVRNYNHLPVTVSWYLNVRERHEKSRWHSKKIPECSLKRLLYNITTFTW